MSLIYTAPCTGVARSGDKKRGLYIGGKADAKSRKKLDELGVTHILNVTPEKESGIPNYFEKDKRLTYKRIPVYDASTSDLLSQADPIVGFISSGLHHGSVLVHCKMGASRSATCVIFFLMRKLGMTFNDAFALCRRRRPDVNPIPAFIMQMRKYEMKCRKMGLIRKDESGEAQSKKRKSPVGPQRGPLQGSPIGPSLPAQGPSIGPALPPGQLKPERTPVDEPVKKRGKTDGDGEEKAIGAAPSIGPTIGLAIGPGADPKVKEGSKSNSNAQEMPPSVDKRA